MHNELIREIEELLQDRASFSIPTDLLRRLDAELQQQVEAHALISGMPPSVWVLGGTAAGGFGSISQRFIEFHTDSIRTALNDPQGDLRPECFLASGESEAAVVQRLALLIIEILDGDETLVVPETVAAIVALWLHMSNLDGWAVRPSRTPERPVNWRDRL
jgi:hypothetical protein